MARRRISTASAWSRIASSATRGLPTLEELLDSAHTGRVQRVLGLGGVQHDDAALFGAGNLEIALAHAAMEGQIHLLERVERAIADSPYALGRVEIEEQCQIGYHPARGQRVEIADGLEIHATPEALISERGIGITIGDNHSALGKGGTDHVRHVLLA